MARHGFIHDKLDIKLLILYIMARVATPIDLPTLTELTLCDDGIDYFDYAECVADLVENENLRLETRLYSITERGARNCEFGESSLPRSVCLKCDKALKQINAVLKRNAQVRVEIDSHPDSVYKLRLILDDDMDNMMTVELLTMSETQAKQMGERFREKPELLYNGILNLLAEKKEPQEVPEEEPRQEQGADSEADDEA